jgi:hypothetical protein
MPPPPVLEAMAGSRVTDDDLACATEYATPRSPVAVERLARRILTGTMLVKYSIVWAAVSLGLWILGTAAALVITKLVPVWGSAPILVLGFGGLAVGFASGYVWIRKRCSEAQTIAREGQLVAGIATYRRSQDTFGGELSEILASPLGETRYCVVFSIGFIRHEMWVAFPTPHDEGERHYVLVQPGARHALAFDTLGRGYVGELQRIA